MTLNKHEYKSWRVSTSNVSEEHIASIFRVKERSSARSKQAAICSSETSDDTQWTTQRYIPGVDALHNHHCENFKSYNTKVVCFLMKTREFWCHKHGFEKGISFHTLYRCNHIKFNQNLPRRSQAHIRRCLYMCPLDYAKWAAHYGLHQYKLVEH
jgi:hypothetical protein